MTKQAPYLVLLSFFLGFAGCASQPPPPETPRYSPPKITAYADPGINDAADRAVERSVRELLELAGISTFDMFVHSRGGQVSLSGVIPNAETGARIFALTKQLKRVKEVRQEFTITPPPAPAAVVAENNSGFPYLWASLPFLTLLLGYWLGSRRARKRAVSTPKITREASLHEVPSARDRAS